MIVVVDFSVWGAMIKCLDWGRSNRGEEQEEEEHEEDDSDFVRV